MEDEGGKSNGLILHIWPSSEYVCVYENYPCLDFTLNFVSDMMQP